MKSNIKNLMEQKKINITELGKKASIGRTSLSEIVNSDTILEKTRIGTLASIANALNVEICELFNTDAFVEIVYETKLKELPKVITEKQKKEIAYRGFRFYFLLIFKVSLEESVFYYPIAIEESFDDKRWLVCDVISEFELSMLKEKNEKVYNEISIYTPMKHTPSRILESEKLLEKFSYLVFNFSLIFFEDSYDQLEQLHLIVTNEEEKFSPHDDVMILWNHYFALLDSNFDLTEHDIEDTILFLGSKSTKTLERVRFKEGFRVIPSWFSE